MARNKSPEAGLTRRNFLKTTGAAAGLAGLGATGMFSADAWLSPAKAVAESEEKVAYTFHQAHCTGHCSLKCTVRDGRLSLIEPSDAWEDERYATCCLKGLSEIQHVYGAERIQTPLKRVGKRGSGEFVSITWDEALSIISEKLTELWGTYGKDSVIVAGTSDVKVRYPHLQKLFGAQNDGLTGIDVGIGNGLEPAIGVTSSFGISSVEARDWVNAKTIIMASTNFLESSMMTAKCFFEAKEAGCKIITIDPNFTTTASKSDQWVPIKPGTDGALFLGMISCIIEKGWFDEDFMKNNTSFPFLVDKDSGALLRQTPTNDVSESGADNPFMVWDENSNSLKPYSADSVEPALSAEQAIGGRTHVTVFDLLKDSQKQYSLSWASEKTGIDEETIVDLCEQFALRGPSTLSLGWGGSDKYTNADICGHAAAILGAITGNFGKKGAGVGVYIGGNYCGYSATLATWKLPAEMVAAKNEMPSYDMRYKPNKVKAYIAMGDMFQQHYANMNVTTKWLDSLDFIAYVDIYHTTSADWADVVLPACSKFETEEEVESLKVSYGHLLMQGKVIEPLFESKTDLWIERALAKSMGLDGYLPQSAEEFCKYQIESATDKKLAGMTLEMLKENNGILPLPGIEEPRRDYDTQIKKTASGKVDVYYEDMIEVNQGLPQYEEPSEVGEKSDLRDKYPLQFSQIRTKFHIHSMFCDATWIQQFYEPYLELNKIDMQERNLTSEDIVEVFNDRGSFSCKVKANEMVQPGTARIYEGMWSKYMESGNIQNLTNDTISSRSPYLGKGAPIPYLDTLVEVKKA